jgi:hypothetical protein
MIRSSFLASPLLLFFLLLVGTLTTTTTTTTTFAFTLTPSTNPELIVQSQLLALQQRDMAGVYQYASPTNQAQVGDLDRFSQMIQNSRGPYRPLIGHTKSDILLSSQMFASKQYLVRVVFHNNDDDNNNNNARNSKIVEYWWSLSRCKIGRYAGCYMVDAVIPNQ